MELELQAQLFQGSPKAFRRPGQRLVSQLQTLPGDWLAGSIHDSSGGIAPAHPEAIESLEDDRAPIDCWGIQCGNGWFELIDHLARACEQEIDRLILDSVPMVQWPRIAQVKEKFGGLRFCVHGDLPDSLRARIRQVETETSLRTCEDCGRPGTRRPGAWIHTTCDICEAQHLARKNAFSNASMAEFDARLADLKSLLDGRPE